MQLIAFKHRPILAKMLANKLKLKISWAELDHYAAGELKVIAPQKVARQVTIVADVEEDPASLVSLLLLAAALRSSGARHLTLVAPWMAYGRQDRVDKPGQTPAGLVVAKVLGHSFDRIITLDAHSPTFIKAFGKKLVNVLPIPPLLPPLIKGARGYLIAAPDRGATERAKRFARALGLPWIVIEKHRGSKGVWSKISRSDLPKVKLANVLIVDDMADSGGTLVSAAKVLRRAGAKHVEVYVTHVMDMPKLKTALKGHVSLIRTTYDHKSHKLSLLILSELVKKLA
ncbi:MAG: ribose-phosphate diphosphokinase [Patescibacteria group bacterium]|nr:ribose-phosphate diphosphokinase [Patescibacteria group bacterium]